MKGVEVNKFNNIDTNQCIEVKNNVIARCTACSELLYYKENMYITTDTLDDLAILQKFYSLKYTTHHFDKRRAIPLSKYKIISRFKTLSKSLSIKPV